MAMFNCYVSSPEGNPHDDLFGHVWTTMELTFGQLGIVNWAFSTVQIPAFFPLIG